MDAWFFLARPEAARDVSSSHDLPVAAAAEPLRIEDPSPLAGLANLLGASGRARPLRDATCRSFPVWQMGAELSQRIAALGDAEIDDTAERWQKHDETSLDADSFELAMCLADLREAIRNGDPEDVLFVLLEERPW